MGRFTKRLIVGLAGALTLAGGAFADFLLDDMEGGSNANKIGYYWYYVVADNDRVGAIKAQDIAGEGYKHIITNAGPGDQFGDLTFSPLAGTGYGGGSSAALVYQNLDFANVDQSVCSEPGGCQRYPTIGMGTSITSSDDTPYGPAFNNVESIEFWMKAVDVDTVFFKVETTDNSVSGRFGPTNVPGTGWWPQNKQDIPGKYDRNPSNAWMKKIHPSSEWTKYTVRIADATGVTDSTEIKTITAPGQAGDLNQDGWWGWSFVFKKEKVTKIAWQINNDKNEKKAGAIYVDDIKLIGPNFTFVPADQCLSCPGKTLPAGTKFKVSDFENADPLQNALGFYWYPYTDVMARTDGSVATEVSDYWTVNEHTGDEILDVTGHGNASNGVEIGYTLGQSPFEQNRGGTVTKLTAFAGIGTNLFDTTVLEYANLTGATGIYFEYKTANVDFLAVEFSDYNDISNAGLNGDNDDGQVYYTKIPGSTTWTGAVIPFDSLVLPSWIKAGDRRYGTKLDIGRLAKIQFKYTGTTNGNIAIDNLYFLGVDKVGNTLGVKQVSGKKALASGLRATYSRGVVGVNWNAAQSIASGKVQLVNTKGRVVASTQIAKTAAGKITANLGAGTIPTGMYFVRVNAKDVNGKKLVQQAALSIVR